jgi:hypothetical protein
VKKLCLCIVILLFPGVGLAAPAEGCFECIFGAANTHAVTGHGRLTAAFSDDGDLTVLVWPSPSIYDQLCYLSSNAPDARERPHAGALDTMGSYVGLWVTTASGSELHWPRDDGWTHSQTYSSLESAVPVTTFENADLGLVVTITDVIAPGIDALTRRVRVERQAGSGVQAISLVVYENLSPSLSRVAQMPLADWAFDSTNDFLAAWDPEARAILHFHPGDRANLNELVDVLTRGGDLDFGPIETLMQSQDVLAVDAQSFVEGLDAAYEPGVLW